MKTGIATQRFLTRLNSFILVGVFIVLAAVVAVPFYSARSSSLPGAKALASTTGTTASMATSNPRVAPWPSIFNPLLPAPQPSAEGIATYLASDCSTPKSDFDLGETVCAKASGVPPTLFPWQVAWLNTAGLILQTAAASTDDATQFYFTLPMTPSSVGTWRVNLLRANGAVRQSAPFSVHNPALANADVLVQKFVHSVSASVAQGDNISFTIVVGNVGPDAAVAVHLLDSTPSGGSLALFTQQSGPSCLPAGESNCTMASLANGEQAEFRAIYDTGGISPSDYETSATVSSTTADNNASNNTSTARFSVTTAGTGATSCQLTCPDNVNATASTTVSGQRGTYVTLPATVTNDPDLPAPSICGSVSYVPASGSFFPVGQTVVNVASETGDGACTFTVTVTDHGTNPPTISCPANPLPVDANSSCEAAVAIGNPTVTGENVTFSGVRSDGKPMYNCDCFANPADACDIHGSCTRRADAPFAAGVTTITWTAYSHDIPGPYGSPDAEEAHRVGDASCIQTITVNDVTKPTIAAADQTASADANCQAPVPDFSTIAHVSDNCACASSDTSEICDSRQDITITQSPAPGTLVGLGPHDITLTANDGSSNNEGAGNTRTIVVKFTVNDTTAPAITCPANLADVPTDPGICAAFVDPGTATATDNCDSNPTITAVRSDGQPLTATYPRGTTTITWTATDAAGNHSSCDQTITVVDKEPPVIVLNGVTPSMWPPNHKYQTFGVTNFVTGVTDNCDSISVSSVVITQVTSDEIENGNGDGNTLNDIVIAGDCKSVQLRAEREGYSNGRVYTIYFKVSDTSGNVGTATAKVVVQHNPGETAVDSGVHYTVISNCP